MSEPIQLFFIDPGILGRKPRSVRFLRPVLEEIGTIPISQDHISQDQENSSQGINPFFQDIPPALPNTPEQEHPKNKMPSGDLQNSPGGHLPQNAGEGFRGGSQHPGELYPGDREIQNIFRDLPSRRCRRYEASLPGTSLRARFST